MKNLQKYNITNIHRIHHEKCSIMFIHDLKKKLMIHTNKQTAVICLTEKAKQRAIQ